VATTECVHAESGEEVKIPFTICIEEVGPVSPDVKPVEADGFEHPCQLVVQVLIM
jgi:hypothetical protein